jgi:BolA protein
MTDLAAVMRERLAPFAPTELEIRDDSQAHAGHGAAGGHFAMRIVSSRFAGKGRIERQRMVYHALGDLMTSEIHALSIDAKSPDET